MKDKIPNFILNFSESPKLGTFTSDLRYYYTVTCSNSISVWDVKNGLVIDLIKHPQRNKRRRYSCQSKPVNFNPRL